MFPDNGTSSLSCVEFRDWFSGMSDIFISYAKEDKNRVKSLAHALERRGWSVWWDERIPAGQSYEEFIEKALKTAKSVVVVWTKTSVKSQWVKNEAKRGLRRNVLIPVMLLEEVEIPLEFEHLQAAHLMDWHPDQDHAGFDQFVGDLVHVIGASSNAEGHRPAVAKGQEPPPAPAHENPPGTSTGRVGSKQSPPYLIIGAGLLVVVGAFVGQWFLSPIPRPILENPPLVLPPVQMPPIQDQGGAPSSGPESPVAQPQAKPTTTQETTATKTPDAKSPKSATARPPKTEEPPTQPTVTKMQPAVSSPKNITGKDGAAMVLVSAGVLQVKKGVVKITAQLEGKNRVGSGVVVKLDENQAYIVTASHVIEGDQHPNVFFYAAPHRAFRARVLGLEGGDPAGIAALLVEGKIPSDLVALPLDQTTGVSGGEPITLIGFPRTEGSMWTVTTGTLSGRRGAALSFSGTVDEGNSGGPLLYQGKVVGIVTEVGYKFNSAAPAILARFALDGWGVRLPD